MHLTGRFNSKMCICGFVFQVVFTFKKLYKAMQFFLMHLTGLYNAIQVAKTKHCGL